MQGIYPSMIGESYRVRAGNLKTHFREGEKCEANFLAGDTIVCHTQAGQVMVYDKDVYLHNVNIISNVVMSFLNALACSNIYIHKEQSKQPHKLKKDALPFDDYHVLMLNNNHSNEESGEHNSHRHPRQHLRRGHIRRYKSGITIWINSMVVCPETKTKIIKDYKVV